MTGFGDGAAGSPGSVWCDAGTSDRAEAPAADATLKPTIEAIHRDHYDFIHRCLRGLGVYPEVIDDAAQETLFVAYRHLPDYEPRTPLRGWLFTIAFQVARNYRRAARRRRRREEQAIALPVRAPSPEAEFQRKEAFGLVERFLDGVDDGKRAVFVLMLMEELPAPEVAATLGIPLNTVYSRLRAVREAFRTMLRRHYEEGP
ncbi:MAG: sigma-70 family RNA polymerase sigma factor [Polyangiaceae bacterium]|nr:sigma-70 family RNA polymerase sigma factor [Polyangiaceae bacterium]